MRRCARCGTGEGEAVLVVEGSEILCGRCIPVPGFAPTHKVTTPRYSHPIPVRLVEPLGGSVEVVTLDGDTWHVGVDALTPIGEYEVCTEPFPSMPVLSHCERCDLVLGHLERWLEDTRTALVMAESAAGGVHECYEGGKAATLRTQETGLEALVKLLSGEVAS